MKECLLGVGASGEDVLLINKTASKMLTFLASSAEWRYLHVVPESAILHFLNELP